MLLIVGAAAVALSQVIAMITSLFAGAAAVVVTTMVVAEVLLSANPKVVEVTAIGYVVSIQMSLVTGDDGALVPTVIGGEVYPAVIDAPLAHSDPAPERCTTARVA
jgi:hypothetical protein